MSSIKNTPLSFVKQSSLTICLVALFINPAFAKDSSDWRTDYKAMVQANYANDYDKATDYAKTTLDKVVGVSDQIEKNIALDQIIRQLRTINANYEKQQNYGQQEIVLKSILRANEAKSDDSSTYQITNARKNLAVCLILEGKNKEAEEYLPKSKRYKDEIIATSGWKRDLELLSHASKTDDRDNIYKYGKSAVDEALSVKNTTEKEVALTQILQQLQMNEYKFKNGKDYPSEEKMLKLILQLQQAQDSSESQKSQEMIFGNFQSTSTLKNLVTCLVMQGKNDEAATYDVQYKVRNEKMMKQIEQFQRNFQDQLLKQQQPPKDKI